MLRLVFTALLLSAAPALAQEPPPEGGPPRLMGVFISPAGEPFRARPGEPYAVEAWFAGADKNGDGALTLQEFRDDALRFFKVVDANGDGIVDGFENTDYETKIAPEILPRIGGGLRAEDVMTRRELSEMRGDRGGMGGGGGPPGGGRRGGGPMRSGAALFGLLDEPQPVRGADTDLDYKVTAKEWGEAAARRFGKLDTNADRRLDLTELPPTPVQQMLAGGEGKRKKKKR